MSTLTSTFPYSGTMPSSQTKKTRGLRTSIKSVHTTATAHVASGLAKVRSDSSEAFYQDHAVAIFMALYLETAMGPLLGMLAIYVYTHWMM